MWFCKSFFHYWALLSYSIHFQPFPLVIFDAYFLFTYSLWYHDQIWVLSIFILIKIQIYSENHPNSCNTFWRANDHDRSMNMQFFFVFSVCFFSNQHQGFLLIRTPLLGKYVEIKMLVVTNVENRMYMYKKKKKSKSIPLSPTSYHTHRFYFHCFHTGSQIMRLVNTSHRFFCCLAQQFMFREWLATSRAYSFLSAGVI